MFGAVRASCLIVACLILSGLSAPLAAEQAPGAPEPRDNAPHSPVLVLDYDALFAGSEFGRRVLEDIEAEGRALIAENDRIEAELSAEELLLTSQRDSLPSDEFRALADAFDAKVQRLRAQQDAKARAVGQGRSSEERRFRQLSSPIIGRFMQEAGALLVIDRDQAIVWVDVIDITEPVMSRVNEAIGTGTPPPTSDPLVPAQD